MSTSSLLRSRVHFPEVLKRPRELQPESYTEVSSASSDGDGEASESSSLVTFEELNYDTYKSPCAFRASNDEYEPTDIDEFEVCSRTFYGGCNLPQGIDENAIENDVATQQAQDIFELEILFDFELWRRRNASPIKTLQHLEPVLLEHVASVVGLKDCMNDDSNNDVVVAVDSNNNNDGGGGIRRRQQQEQHHRRQQRRHMEYKHDFTPSELDLMVGISSKTEDFVDDDYDECKIPVTHEDASGGTCKPATGIMRIYLKNDPPLTGEQKTSLTNGFLRLIRFGMQEDVYVGGNTKHVSFIGDRTDADTFLSFREPTRPDSSTNFESLESSNGNLVAYVITAAGCAILVVFILFFLIKPRRQQHDQKLESDFLDAVASSSVGPSSASVGSPNQSFDAIAAPSSSASGTTPIESSCDAVASPETPNQSWKKHGGNILPHEPASYEEEAKEEWHANEQLQ